MVCLRCLLGGVDIHGASQTAKHVHEHCGVALMVSAVQNNPRYAWSTCIVSDVLKESV